jgi:hypothetical protein
MNRLFQLLACLLLLAGNSLRSHAAETRAELTNLAINGGIQDGKARLILEANLRGGGDPNAPTLYATALDHGITVSAQQIQHTATATFDLLQGQPDELLLTLTGPGEIQSVTGEALLDWSVRRETNGLRSLVLRPRKSDKPLPRLTATIVATAPVAADVRRQSAPSSLPLLTFSPVHPALSHGHLRITTDPDLDLQTTNTVGIVPLDPRFLPESLRTPEKPGGPVTLAFRFQGSAYALSAHIQPADPDARRVVLRNFQLNGQLDDRTAAFTLTAIASVTDPRGGTVELLSGSAALADLDAVRDGRIRWENGRYLGTFDKPGEFPVQLRFNAAVRTSNGWNRVDFRVATATLQPVALAGLPAETQFEFDGAARPVRTGETFTSHLPPDGTFRLAWKSARPEAEGRLFYAAEMLSQVTIGPGLMRQVALLEGKVMQGEMQGLTLDVRGTGNITAVQGLHLLGWELQPGPDANTRRLVLRFNQPRKDGFSLQIQMQAELPAFPQSVDAIEIRPQGATRFAGHFRVVNDGAVRLEVLRAAGLSQVAPEQFPESDRTRALLATAAPQRFVYRFSGADYALRIQADNIQPEVSVSQVLAYHLGETEASAEAELELDIREAPLREVLVRIPRGFAVARLTAQGLSDYFVREPAGEPDSELRLVYAKPIADRQLIQFRLERNTPLTLTNWTLPRIEVLKARSTRGHVAVSSDPGLRLTPDRTTGLTDIATAFFPRKLAGIQSAFRITDPDWQATLRVERLPQSIQADVFHLFSIGEGIAYGSSTMNFFVSGAPVSTFEVSLSDEYFNVEFTGKDLRGNWQRTTNGYRVHLNTPVSGAYTLLATYERPFKAQGDTLTFTGARPLDAQTEQGHTLVVSAYQFQVTPSNVSPGLLALETAEVPSEYRLFFDAPILAAYRYSARPFNLQLSLSPLVQGETLSLVIDRAALTTRVSKDGEVLTDVRYFIKNRGNPHLRLTLPAGVTLWSATVNGTTVVPVKDGDASLLPLPQKSDPNTVQTLDLKLASRSTDPSRVTAFAPVAAAPVLLAEWRIQPDTGRQLTYRSGSLTPAQGFAEPSALSVLPHLFSDSHNRPTLLGILLLLLTGALACRWSVQMPNPASSLRRFGGPFFTAAFFVFALILGLQLNHPSPATAQAADTGLTFLAPIQQAGSNLHIDLDNRPVNTTPSFGKAWPAAFALVAWGLALTRNPGFTRSLAIALGWTLLAWASLRLPTDTRPFSLVIAAFAAIHCVLPAISAARRTTSTPPPPAPTPTPPDPTPGPSPTPAAAAALLLGLSLWASSDRLSAAEPQPALAESITHDVRVEEGFATATTRIRWNATRNQSLPILFDPAVLLRANFPTNALRLIQAPAGSRRGHHLLALTNGPVDIDLHFQFRTTVRDGVSGLVLPTPHGLVNRLNLTLADLDVDVSAPDAVSIDRQNAASNATSVRIILAPATDPWIAWRPRSRDIQREKPVFYAETTHLFTPTAGLVEGLHVLQIRPAQGQLSELLLDIPAGATITDVADANPVPTQAPAANGDAQQNRPTPAPIVSLWRFDPDTRRLRITLAPAQSRPFALVVRSQIATGALPVEQRVEVPTVVGAAGQVGAVGIATGNEVQLDSVTLDTLSPLNLEDYPAAPVQFLQSRMPGLGLRRAFRHTEARGSLTLKASAVEPDIRVETQDTLSLGEDRTVLASNLKMTVTRAGIFRVSFALPAGLDVESITGPALSHWTELKSATERIITLHLKGRTEGEHPFSINLAGPGTRGVKSVAVPRLLLREASKQRGQLVIVPEQGLRLQVGQRDGVTQLDPEKAGIRQKGVLAFRLLQPNWNLALELEQVDAWVQVTSLQHVQVTEAQLKVTANLRYQIENTGLKSLFVRVPTNATGLRLRGDQVADFVAQPNSITNGLQLWEVKLHRRAIGKYDLQATWQTPLAEAATNTVIQGLLATDARLQRGFVTLQSAGRLQLSTTTLPSALQPAEWQSIPRTLLQDLDTATANLTYRLVEPTFSLPLGLVRHEAARLLPARVHQVTLTSVISDEGVMLTQARIEIVPGDKRLLQLTLPADARFWFAFVNQNGVYPWREQDRILIPLEQQSRPDKPTTVEFFYSSRIGDAASRKLDLALNGPKFDLPLEDITWQVYLNSKWTLEDWSGSLQLESTDTGSTATVDVQSYLQGEQVQNDAKTKAAEEMLQIGNRLLVEGDPQKARRAFQNAFGLSTHDNAFNEDARVQLHNLKVQQALVGLNVRQAAVAGESAPAAGNLRQLRNRSEANYTQQEAKDLFALNGAADNATLEKLAERIIEQQDAALPSPTAIRASIPQQGRMLTFKRSVQVETWTDLNLHLAARSANAPNHVGRFASFAALALSLTALVRFTRPPKM